MSKIEFLFDGTTIINFPYIIKLFKRYLKSSILISILLSFLCTGFYLLQEEVYWTSISFSDSTSDDKPDIKGALGGLGGLVESKGGIRATDILNLRSSIDFNRKIALDLISSEFFSKLRFDLGMFGSRKDWAVAIDKHCSHAQNCMVQELLKRLPKFYQISDKDRGGVNFILEVKALDNLTANVLLKTITKRILDSRIEAVRYNLKSQEATSTNMLIEKKKEVDVTDFYELQEDRDRLDSELREIQSKIDHQVNVITSVQDSLASAESSYQRSKKISSKRINNDDIDLETHRRELRDRVAKLNSDLIALEDTLSNPSDNDKLAIAQLKNELKGSRKKLKSLGEGSSQTNLNQFVKQNDEKLRSKELDFGVIKDQLDAAKQIYEDLIIKKKDVLDKKIKATQAIEILKPSIKFIKNLEMKIEQLKLSVLTVTPDVRFDNYAAAPEPVKKVGFILMLGYFLIIQSILLVLYLSLRFLLDRNLYDIDDIKGASNNLKIIGNGPKYG